VHAVDQSAALLHVRPGLHEGAAGDSALHE
jgi:hypothetical protein